MGTNGKKLGIVQELIASANGEASSRTSSRTRRAARETQVKLVRTRDHVYIRTRHVSCRVVARVTVTPKLQAQLSHTKLMRS